MSASVLRQAASEMRRIANNATPGRWKLWGMSVMADQDGTSNVDDAVPVAHTGHRDENGQPRTWDASQIAGMQPAVALAVADWLEAKAEQDDKGTCDGAGTIGVCNLCEHDYGHVAALNVARAYLGRDA